MFSFFGSKSKIVNLYPPPKFPRIIEPFAGSARYALKYHHLDVLLVEIDPIIYRIWYWLIHEATKSDIAALPRLKRGDDLRNMKQLSDVERDLLGFAVSWGMSRPGNIVTPRADATGWDKSDPRWRPNNCLDLLKTNILRHLDGIKHWKIVNTSYEKLRINPEVTWFIDAPYQCPAGRSYTFSDIDYKTLASWCKKRRGQVIVCESREADWLPFIPMTTGYRGSMGPLKESVYLQ